MRIGAPKARGAIVLLALAAAIPLGSSGNLASPSGRLPTPISPIRLLPRNAQSPPVTWTLQSFTPPKGDAETFLSDASCLSKIWCMTVGYYATANDNYYSLALEWDGTSWSVVPTTDPTNTTFSSLQQISCVSEDSCVAVGSYQSAGGARPMAESWNGVGWSLDSVPAPSGTAEAFLSGLSCVTSFCMATGDWIASSGATESPLAEEWNGSQWSITPTPSLSSQGGLAGVSCSSSGCMAVGEQGSNASGVNQVPVAMTWNGSSWTARTPVIPSAASSWLNGVSCLPGLTCVAVGGFQSHSSGPAGGRPDQTAP